jgi:hypothetical protein
MVCQVQFLREQIHGFLEIAMKKDLVTHLVFTLAFFLLVSLIRDWFAPAYIPFWIGGLLGIILPDLDYIVNIYFLHPQAATSQNLAETIKKSSLTKSWDAIVRSRYDHKDLIFHTVYFQLIFIVFTFLMMTSSGSVFGIGVVLAFSLHLIIDQVVDLTERGKSGIGSLN